MRLLMSAMLAIGMACPNVLFAHGGGLDRYGCHKDNVRGGYHCHRDRYDPSATESNESPSIYLDDTPAELIRATQENLLAMNYYKGVIDGLMSGEIVTAVLDYQWENKLPTTGKITESLVEHSRRSRQAGQRYISPSEQRRQESQIFNPPDAELIKKVQGLLNQLGYPCGEVNGVVGGQTVGAVLDYQYANKLDASGKIDDGLLKHLQAAVIERRK